MTRASYEALIGALVVAGLLLVIGILYSGSGRNVGAGYDVTVRFQRLDGLAEGSEVRVSGVTVGRILTQVLDDDFRAIVTMRIDGGIPLPTDTTAAIYTDGLLGAKYIDLQPGGDEEMIPAGGSITLPPQNAVIIQDLLELIVSESQSSAANAPR